MKVFASLFLGSALIFFLSWFTVSKLGINKLDIQSEDTVPAMFLPFSVLKNHSIYLDEFYNQMILRYPQPDDKSYTKGNVPFYLKKVDSHFLSAFTIVTPLVVLPVYVLPVLLNLPPSWPNLIILSHIAEALVMGLAGWFVYLISYKRLHATKHNSLLAALVFLFATVNFAMVSQALWQHGTVQLLLLIGVYFYLGERPLIDLWLAGLFWGFAFFARPTALLPIAVFGLLLWFRQKNFTSYLKSGSILALGLLPALLFFLWYNAAYYGSFSNQGYSSQLFTSWLGNFPISFFGVWLSPSKGILVYSPVLLFSLVGMFLTIKSFYKDNKAFYIACGLIVIFHTLIISFWKHWYGGWSYGYRMTSDVIPFFAILLIPFLESALYQRYKKLFWVLFSLSVFIELAGIIFFDGVWHAAYDRGFHDTSWLWSIKDSEMVFNVRRVLVKFHLLKQACPKCLPY